MKTLNTETRAARKRLAASLARRYTPESLYDHLTSCLDVLASGAETDDFYGLTHTEAYATIKRFIDVAADRTVIAGGYQAPELELEEV